jgi:hypothetical protein
MATLEQLQAEMARRQGGQPQQAEKPKGDRLAQLQAESVRRGITTEKPASEKSFFDKAGDVAQSIPGVPFASELMTAIVKGGANTIDFLGPDNVNAIFELAGSDTRMPTMKSMGAGEGNFMEPGTTRNIVQTAGQMIVPGAATGGAIRTAAQRIAPEVQTIGANLLRQAGTGTASGDVALSAASGVGAEVGGEIGGETGALVGSVLAPVAGVAATTALTKLIGLGKSGIQSLMQGTMGMSDDGAATLLAEAMVRENLSPEDITKQLANLGPEALPADIGNNFARLLRTASNKIPRIEGQAADVFKARQSGQGNRLLSAVDDATGTASLTVDDEIKRINTVLRPEIDAAYKAAKAKSDLILKAPKQSKGMSFTEKSKSRLEKLLSGEGVAGSKVKNKADLEIKAKQLSGENITSLDMIDATKRALDDEIGEAIRSGASNKSRSLVMLKNSLLKEVDSQIPEYKQARSLFAGKAELENAADSGGLFLKMKARDMQELTKSMGESEKRMFKLGAKQAIFDKIDDISMSRDSVKALFGKNGDVKKLRYLFDDEAAYKQFADTLKRESDFVMTRRAAQANSTTAKQMSDEMGASEAFNNALQAVQSPVQAAGMLGRVLGGLSAKRGDEAFTMALEEVGDILLTKGMNPDKLQALLRKGSAKQIEAALRNSISKELSAPRIAPLTTSVVSEGASEPRQSQGQMR